MSTQDFNEEDRIFIPSQYNILRITTFMNGVEKILKNLLLPEEKDISHQFRLRRALLQSTYLDESTPNFWWSLVKFYLAQRRVYVPGMVVMLVFGGVATTWIRGEVAPRTLLHLPQSAFQEEQKNSPTVLLPALVKTADKNNSLPLNVVQLDNVHYTSASEMNQILHHASVAKNGVLMLDTTDGTYIYRFDRNHDFVPAIPTVTVDAQSETSRSGGSTLLSMPQ